MTTSDPLDRPATRATLESLFGAGHLNARARGEAVRMIRPPLQWWTWANRFLLFLGVLLLLAGIIFFFAWNWAAMGAFLRFALIGAGLTVCIISAWWLGLDRLTGQVFLLAAAVLVGVFLAVFGQTYQTGADLHDLFLAWAILILGWVLLARFAPLWILWLALINTGVFAFWDQVMVQEVRYFEGAPFVILALVDGAFLLICEVGHRRNVPWLADAWYRWLLLAAVLTLLTVPVLAMIFDGDEADFWTALAAVLWTVTLGAAWRFHRFRTRDLPALTLLGASVCVVVLSLLGKGLFEVLEEEASLLILGFLILGVVSLAVMGLRSLGKTFERERHGG